MSNVLFVCLGNICRSPAAEGVYSRMATAAGIEASADSAGTSNWHIGYEPYAPMQDAAGQRGYELSHLRARQFRVSDFDEFDLIIGMDNANIGDMESMRPTGNVTPIRLFLDYAPRTAETEVPDPYYTRDYEQALDLIEEAAKGLVATLINGKPAG